MQPDDPYDRIAAWYDLEHAGVTDDLELYLGFAEATGSPILELGCGSGRLLVPLAEAGYAVTGVDSSAAMLERCRERARTAGVAEQVTLVQGDMRHLALPARDYRLAFVALGTFQHLASLADRRAALAAIRAHVIPGATLVLDLAQAEPRRLAALAEAGQIAHIGTWRDPAADTMLTHTLAARPGPAPATLTLAHWYDVYQQNGPVTRTSVETTLAAISRHEIELLLAATGWRLRQIYGDHQMDDWDESSPRLIAIAQAAE
jgi:SAM-dependent methyltransferase